MVHISEISYKNRKACTYLYDFDHEKTTITTGYLKKTQSGLQILAVRGFRNRSGRNFSRRDFKMPAFLSLRICKDFSCKSSSMKSVTGKSNQFSTQELLWFFCGFYLVYDKNPFLEKVPFFHIGKFAIPCVEF